MKNRNEMAAWRQRNGAKQHHQRQRRRRARRIKTKKMTAGGNTKLISFSAAASGVSK